MQQTPKPYRDKLKLRRDAFGTERRRNMSKLILENQSYLPKPIEYSDIDESMYKWVEDNIKITYDGKRLPTYKLYSTQRLSEYLQTWDKQDEAGNPIINFLTITRDLNPQKGESQGNYFNIPGHKDFAMFYVPVMQENGTEAFDKYTMKQPFQVNFLYTISVVSNKMEIVNEMNELIHYEFSAIDCYISPNGHPMSMTLENISDESEYTINDRKYYSQSYKVKVRGYIIRKEDYKVERIPSRYILSSHDSDASGIVNRRGKNRRQEDKVKFIEGYENTPQYAKMKIETLKSDDKCSIPPIVEKQRPSEIYEETSDNNACCEVPPSKYYNKVLKLMVYFDDCTEEVSFEIDKDMIVDYVEVTNVFDFKVLINGELVDLDNEVKFLEGDDITVRITREDDYKDSELILVGFDPNSAFDRTKLAEVSLDEPIDEEHIMINYKDEEK